jgi:GntR family transcriptional regulator
MAMDGLDITDTPGQNVTDGHDPRPTDPRRITMTDQHEQPGRHNGARVRTRTTLTRSHDTDLPSRSDRDLHQPSTVHSDRLVVLIATDTTKQIMEVRGCQWLGYNQSGDMERWSAVHRYERVARELAEEIESGDWPPGTLLPTIPALAERFGVSPVTVRGGLDQLAKRGLTYTGYQGGRRGTIVRSAGRVDHHVRDEHRRSAGGDSHDFFAESARRAGRQASKHFEMRIATPPVDVARRLGIPGDALVVVRVLRQFLDGEPWSRETSYYPRNLAEDVGLDVPHDITKGTVRALADAGHTEVSWVDEVTDEHASPEDAQDLAVQVGSPLLVQTRTAATDQRITRVTRYTRLGGRVRLIWESGTEDGLRVIQAVRTAP